MPALPAITRRGVVYLYRTRQEAEENSRNGGTAAIIGKKVEGADGSLLYLVSNRHVVYEAAASVVRVNRLDGGAPDIIETEPHEWFPHPQGDDLVIRFGSDIIHTHLHEFGYNPFEKILSKEGVQEFDIDVGDDVFMVGRFVNLQGHGRNEPAVRFGNISVGATPVHHPLYERPQESFAVEMRSRSGFSGSPVFVYWSSDRVLIPKKSKHQAYVGLLGINWGYILDEGENTWLNGVIPGWKVLDLFDLPIMKRFHQAGSEKIRTLAAR